MPVSLSAWRGRIFFSLFPDSIRRAVFLRQRQTVGLRRNRLLNVLPSRQGFARWNVARSAVLIVADGIRSADACGGGDLRMPSVMTNDRLNFIEKINEYYYHQYNLLYLLILIFTI